MNFAFAREYSITLEWSWYAINHTSKSFLIKHKQIGWIQRYKAGGEPYSDTTPFIVSEYSLLLPSMISYLTVYLREAAAGTHLGQERTDSRITSNCRSTIQENIFWKRLFESGKSPRRLKMSKFWALNVEKTNSFWSRRMPKPSFCPFFPKSCREIDARRERERGWGEDRIGWERERDKMREREIEWERMRKREIE